MTVPVSLAANEMSADTALLMAETAEGLFRVQADLPPRMLGVIRLSYQQGKNYAEIGEILNTVPETIRNQRFKALALLRKRFIPD